MAKRLKIKTYEGSNVHFDYEQGGQNYTLCGLDTIGDKTLGIGEAIQVKKKVDCWACIAIVKYCQGIKKSEYEQNI